MVGMYIWMCGFITQKCFMSHTAGAIPLIYLGNPGDTWRIVCSLPTRNAWVPALTIANKKNLPGRSLVQG
jgi:hypothetical protein